MSFPFNFRLNDSDIDKNIDDMITPKLTEIINIAKILFNLSVLMIC